MPRIRKEALTISVTGSALTIKGERKEEVEKKEKHFYHAERRYSSFRRDIEFPTEVDASQIKASYKGSGSFSHSPDLLTGPFKRCKKKGGSLYS